MEHRTVLFSTAGLYLLFRFVTLNVSLLFRIAETPNPEIIALTLAVGTAGALPAVLILQYLLTRGPELIVPMRIGVFLQFVGSVAALFLTPWNATVAGSSRVFAVVIGSVVLIDAAVTVFLLSYRFRGTEERSGEAVPDHPGDTAPDITVEELKE